jgi:hypothetical protein
LELLRHLKALRHRSCDTIILKVHCSKVRTGGREAPKSARSAWFRGTYDQFEFDLVKHDVIEGLSAQGFTPTEQQHKTYLFTR